MEMTNLAATKRPRGPMITLVFGLVGATLFGAPPSQAAPDIRPGEAAPARVKTIRIKNAGTIRVVLGKKREPAAGVRPDKDGWKLVLSADLDGSSAELQDITPNVQATRWTLAVTGEKVALDPERFLPTHVYRVVFRRDHQLLGSALV